MQSLLAAIVTVHPDSCAPTLEDVVAEFHDPWCNPETDSRVALTPDGTVVAFVRLWINPFAVPDAQDAVAYSMNRFDPIAAERTGLKVGWIGSLGTRRAWRKRGLASALLIASMRAIGNDTPPDPAFQAAPATPAPP